LVPQLPMSCQFASLTEVSELSLSQSLSLLSPDNVCPRTSSCGAFELLVSHANNDLILLPRKVHLRKRRPSHPDRDRFVVALVSGKHLLWWRRWNRIFDPHHYKAVVTCAI
jgi:hypothetical protein